MKIRNAAIGTAALALGAVAVAGPALATGSAYQVSVGGSSASGTHNITATAGSIAFGVPGTSMSCTSANVPGAPAPVTTVTSGASVTNIASIAQVNFVGCTIPGGAATVTTTGPWTLHGTGAATSGSSDVVAGHIEGISARVFNAACDFTVTGTARGSFDEATQKLAVSEPGGAGGQLVVASVNPAKPCLSKVKTGMIASFGGTFSIASPDGAILLG